MRLISVSISGIGRISSGKVNLDSKVIAVVGPNEAGKTTLLKALNYITSSESVNVSDRARFGTVEDDSIVVAADFVLDDADRSAVDELGLDLEELPRRMTYQRRAGGGVVNSIRPQPAKRAGPLVEAIAAISKYAKTKAGKEFLASEADDLHETDVVPLGSRLKSFMDSFDERELKSEMSDELLGELSTLISHLQSDGSFSNESVIRALEQIHSWYTRADPWRDVHEVLKSRMPEFVMFSDEDRNLQSGYGLDDSVVQSPPPALASIATLADLDLQRLWQVLSSGQIGQAQTQILQANQQLEHVYGTSWNQSDVTIHLNLDGSTLQIMVRENGREITTFDERSAGLRMFAALRSFLAVRGIDKPPILLIDEAETHLHYNAQADLVDTFMRQEDAAKIIYTTHSPACLPPDLGVGVRAVLPKPDQLSVSEIKNSFWAGSGSAGFSPLMLAMGASAAAFTPARYVVLAEGASEMVVLPSLIRAATGREFLEYQIAPGLSEAALEVYPDLDLEGARVAFLVDGDVGGSELRKRLIDGGVDESLIRTLDAITLENVLDPGVYANRMSELLKECNTGSTVPDLPELPVDNSLPWPTVIEKWAEPLGLKVPSKVAIASAIVESGDAKPSADGAAALIKLDEQLCETFQIKRQS
ncbi:AAA family ATPase [Gordonia sp. ABSL11-1]|uniref:AAA family ATPase n=1 Tax=Gordonia sp. ABSL11-1 TaxID=3053924 RepID=UPI0025739061|nr:AAA family ATPase [Gordonia sp. ABSL11-1]MDL9944607.1 AAA family ATPase [Gordonia sp. ABSL11-1]